MAWCSTYALHSWTAHGVRRVDRLAPLLGAEVGAVVEAALVAAGALPVGAVVGRSAGWVQVTRCEVTDGRAVVSFVVELARLTIRGSDKGARAQEVE